ncbi:MAG: hypothetical protein FH761_17660 [Firmicutes bacterium]|nr:hypothetical protein [Bacillota bacterium]
MEVIGYFSNLKKANKAVKALKKVGFSEAISDMNDHYIADMDIHQDLPGTEDSVSLSNIILQDDETAIDMSKKSLAAANPAVSGMGDIDEITDYNNKVVVNISSSDREKAEKIIEDMGGTIDNPNEIIPKGLDKINIDDINKDTVSHD